MKTLIAVLLLSMLAVSIFAEERRLPKPAKTVGVDLISAIESRKSFKTFSGGQISANDLSTILWSGLGVTWRAGEKSSINGIDTITGATLGERRSTVFAWQPTIKAYIFLSDGCYCYEPVENALVKVSSEDLRRIATTQHFSGQAAVIILVADGRTLESIPGRMEDKLAWANASAGLAAQNIYLTATSLGHGTVILWYVNRAAVRSGLGLSEKDQILYALPLGTTR